MILEYFEEALEIIVNAKAGKVQPSIPLMDTKERKLLSLNSRMRFGKGVYCIVTGPPGTGKTSLVDTTFVMNSILIHINNPSLPKPRIIYRCMERPPVDKMIKFIAGLIHQEYGEIIDVPTLRGFPNRKRLLTDKDIEMVRETQTVIDRIVEEDYLDLVGGSTTPEGIMAYLLAELHTRGLYITSDLNKIYINGKEHSDFSSPEKTLQGKPYKVITGSITGKQAKVYPQMQKFIPHDENLILMTINDTINRIEGSNDLETLNRHSQNMAKLRDANAYGIIDIAQMGRDTERDMRARGSHLSITLKDIKGSGNMGQNADLALSILDPMYFDIDKWGPEGMEYDLKRFHGTFRLLQIFKNSQGGSLFKCPMIFLGENGYFQELPRPENMTEDVYRDLERGLLKHITDLHHPSVQSTAFPKDRIVDNQRGSKRPF